MPKPTSLKCNVLLFLSFLVSNMIMNFGFLASATPYDHEEKAVWERYTSQGEEFSVLMPELPGVILRTTCLDSRCKKKRLDRTYAAYADGVVYRVTSYPNPKHRQSPKAIIAESLQFYESAHFDVTAQGNVTLNKLSGERYAVKSKKGFYESTVIFYLTKDHVYEITAAAEDLNQPAIQKFLESFTLGSNDGKEIGDGARASADFATAPATPKTNTANSNDKQPGNTFRPQELTRKAVIILKGSPEYTEEARKNQVTGVVTLQMIFTASGRVTNIRTISPLPHGLTEQAIIAARNIYFLPAVKDGKRVSMYIRVEYNFNIY